MTDDAALLLRYATARDERAFAELVRRHLGLVYHAALRQCGGDAHRAEDVAQAVFTDLARKAEKLASRPVLASWLYTSTRYAAAQAVRGEARRQAREQEAHVMNEILSDNRAEAVAEWEKLRPQIDDALHALGDRDREAVLLRFFEGCAFAEIGEKLAVSEDAARVRVDRALEKLRATLVRRGITSTTAALGVALASQSAAAAPAGVAASVTGAALASAGVGGGILVAGLFGFMSTTKIATAVAIVAVGIGVVQYRSAREERMLAATRQSELRAKLQVAQQRIAAESKRADEADTDSAKLLQTVEAARASDGKPAAGAPAADGEWVPFERITNRGKATPRDAFETMQWAQGVGDANAMAEAIVLPVRVRQEAEGILAKLPETKRGEYRDAQHFVAALLAGTPGRTNGFQITKDEPGATAYASGHSVSEVYGLGASADTDPNYRTLFSRTPLRDGRTSEALSLFEMTPDGWRFVIPPTKFVTALWQGEQRRQSQRSVSK